MQVNKQGTEKNSHNFFCPKKTSFFALPVCLKYGIIAKPLYIWIQIYGFWFIKTMCKLCNFFKFLFFNNVFWIFLCVSSGQLSTPIVAPLMIKASFSVCRADLSPCFTVGETLRHNLTWESQKQITFLKTSMVKLR